MKWEVFSGQRINEKTKKPITVKITAKKKISCTIGQAISHFKHQLNLFITHEYRITHQNNSMKKLTQSLQSNELHTSMVYSSNFSQGFATLSKSLRHDPSAIIVRIRKLLTFIL